MSLIAFQFSQYFIFSLFLVLILLFSSSIVRSWMNNAGKRKEDAVCMWLWWTAPEKRSLLIIYAHANQISQCIACSNVHQHMPVTYSTSNYPQFPLENREVSIKCGGSEMSDVSSTADGDSRGGSDDTPGKDKAAEVKIKMFSSVHVEFLSSSLLRLMRLTWTVATLPPLFPLVLLCFCRALMLHTSGIECLA